MKILKRIAVKGFKSIKEMDLELRALNVLIGANGAGKSNLVSFFKMLNEMMGGRLQEYVARSGRAHSLLHFGPKVTREIEATLEFAYDSNRHNAYYACWSYVSGDGLLFTEESIGFVEDGSEWDLMALSGGSIGGHPETRLLEEEEKDRTPAEVFLWHLNNCRVFHFNDTSPGARVRQYCYVGDNRRLLADGGNTAAVLHALQKRTDTVAYRRIIDTIRLIAPFFDDFDLAPDGNDIILNWREKGSDQLFGPHQLSDGTLRAICLVTLLLQPVEDLPALIIVDEPELGLHPYALNIIASLFRKAACHTQVLVSTQSPTLLSCFEPEDIIVANRKDKESIFVRPSVDELNDWLEDYTLGEVWEKNVIGGGPH